MHTTRLFMDTTNLGLISRPSPALYSFPILSSSLSVFVSLCTQEAVTKYHSLGDLNNRNAFLRALEAAKTQIKVLARRFRPPASSLGSQVVAISLGTHRPSPCAHREREEALRCCVCNPILMAPSSRTHLTLITA